MQRRSYVEQFEAVAALRRGATAIEAEHGSITYADLDERANGIAAALLGLGVEGRGRTVVGLYAEPGIDYVVGLLGCAKAGCAFLPLPPDLPERRLATQLAKAEIRHIVAGAGLADRLRAALTACGSGAVAVACDAPEAVATSRSPGLPVGPSDPCYVLFTSGSTGAPKAILGQQRGLSHFLRWEIAEFGLDEGCRVSWLAPTTFDVSLRDILVPLMTGGTLLVPDPDTRASPHRLAGWLAARGATLVHIVPTLLRLLTRELEHRGGGDLPLPRLRHLLVAGEPLLAGDVRAWRAAAGAACEVVNLYGPSETTLAKLFHRVAALPEGDRGVLPVGRPLPDAAALILNGRTLCRVGEIGEIHIRTPYRTLGYLAELELTAASFVPNPLGDDPDDVVYRTGDLGRYAADGTIECLGRQDTQVKISGVRIELGEVEAAMREIPAVAEAAAAVHRGHDGSPLLAAYYSRRDGSAEPLEPAAIQAELARTLPVAMRPRLFVALAALPKTISGKVNRKALPRPEELVYGRIPYAAPEGPTEEAVARIWAELFGLSRVSATADFRELGGDSLKAIRAMMRLWQELGVDVPLKELFDNPTVRGLAAVVDRSRVAGSIPHLPDAESYAASAGQERLWNLDRMGMAPTAYNLAEAFTLTGSLDVDALDLGFRDLVARHEALRTTFAERDGLLRQVIRPASDWALARIDLRGEPAPEAAAAAMAAAERDHHFDLVAGPLLRVRLAALPRDKGGAERWLLLFNLHHIVGDLWSLDVLVRELAASYAARRAGGTPALPPLPLRYRDVVAWGNARFAGPEAEKDRRYWHARLIPPPQPLELPTDRPRPAVKTFAGATERFRWTRDESRDLAALADARGVTGFALRAALVLALLCRHAGQDDVALGTAVAGREDAATAGMIGYLANVVVLRQRVDRAAPFSALLEGVSRTVGEALSHGAYPFDALVREVLPNRDIGRSPLFDAMIVDHAFHDAELRLEGITASPFGVENGWTFSRYDLVFHFQDGEDGLVLDLNYNTDLFDADRIRRGGEGLRELARSAVLDPYARVADLALLPPAEAERVSSFEAGPAVPRGPETITARFRAVAALHPRRPAAVEPGRTADYAALAATADRLARHLAGPCGIAPGDRVAVLAGRGVDAVAAMLAVMAAGAVYVPVDPALPLARARDMLRGAGCGLVLRDAGGDWSTADLGSPAIDLPELIRTLDAASLGAPLDRGGPGDVAYIIFTSGSTGRPRAVEVEHAGVVNMALGQIAAFGLGPEDRVVQFASPSFDASIANMLMALLAGGAVLLPPRDIVEDASAFLAYLSDAGATAVTLPPTYLRALGRAALGPVRVLITAGEPAPPEDSAHHARSLAVFNAYGPTETSVCATVHRVGPVEDPLRRVPIGRPLPNTKLAILDEAMRPVPIGVEGDIFLGGAGLARGYGNDPAATERAFVQHPGTGERLYRTGDRGLWRPDGVADFLGRRDEQVKVSGHRVEIGEVEGAMRAVAGVQDAYVAAETRDDGSTALVGYYVPRPTPELWPSIAEFFVYDDVTYGRMAGDEARNRRYRDAFARHLAGKVVIDVGTGPHAVLARLAVEAGARKIYAVDLLPATAEAARRTVAELGLDDRIEVIAGDASAIDLPEPADWCVSEIVGAIGGAEGSAAIVDAVRRHLREPGNMLPRRSLTAIAAAALPEDALAEGFSEIAAHYVERIFADAGRPFDLRLCVKNLPGDALISTEGTFEDLDYTRGSAPEHEHAVELRVLRAARFTGFVVWLRLFVDDDLVVDILESRDSWIPVYLPAVAGGLDVRPGDRLALTVRRSSRNGLNPDFEVDGVLERPGLGDVPISWSSPHRAEGFRASPFYRRLFAGPGVPRRAALSPATLRQRLGTELPGYAVPARLIAVERIPLTVNGKVDRAALAALRPAAAPMGPARAPRTRAEEAVLAAWRLVLERPAIGLDEDFFGLGGDSIRAIRIVAELRRLGWRTAVRDLFQNPTPERLAPSLAAESAPSDSGPVAGEVPLSPIQRWLFDRPGPAPRRFNQAVVLRVEGALDADAAARALAALWRGHDALRARFVGRDGGVRQVLAEPGPADLLEVLPPGVAWDEAAERVHAGFDLGDGPLIRAVLAPRPGGADLLLVAHHAVVDAVSWRILAEDFAAALDRARRGEPAAPTARTASVRERAEALERLARETDWETRLGYWRRVGRPAPLPVDLHAEGGAAFGDAEQLALAIDGPCAEALLASSRRAFGVGIEEVLLGTLGVALARTFGPRTVLVTLEGHGRGAPIEGTEFPDVSRTVGWFTDFFPLALAARDDVSAAEAVRAAASSLRRIPDRGRSYGLMTRHPAGPRAEPLPGQIGFNFLGNLGDGRVADGVSMDWNAPGRAIAPELSRPHALDLLAMAVDGRIELLLDVDRRRYRRETGRRLLDAMGAALAELSEAARTSGAALAPARHAPAGAAADLLDDLLEADE